MKLIDPKFAATTCLFALLATPAAVFAEHHGDDGKGKDWYKDRKDRKVHAVPEPSSLAMALAGMGFVLGLAIVGLRRNRSRSVAV
jgi:PEP-CTERM motif